MFNSIGKNGRLEMSGLGLPFEFGHLLMVFLFGDLAKVGVCR